ncbi:hypothetical protein C1645_803891 [Glomus cerebriforme]|uniref:Uncharacterized protein n=1 Tax=Glomus cerebriforme TaxID=658196 RepID=A0A397T8R5_9GLOM|nr:hypothetical protein C1645_803891 [Glomus cerebriforme]
MTSIHSEISDLNDNKSIIFAETKDVEDVQIREYEDTLKLLADSDSLTYNYALKETIRLMENLVGRPRENIEGDKKVIHFAFKAAGFLSSYPWTFYDSSTIAQLEFFLNTNVINANIMFSLREIRNCLRKIKDDKSNADHALRIGGNFFDVVVSVAQKEYLAAFGSFIKVLDFEYSAGEWYYDWIDRREKFFLLCSKKNSESRLIKKFYKKLFKLSNKEFLKVKRKNTRFRKFEYKLLKSGGLIAGCSLPDNIDTLLIGYLHLIQQLLEKFFPLLEKYVEDLVLFCDEIIETHVKKQLTFKAVEVLYVIKDISENEEIKKEIESNFEIWSSYRDTTSTTSRPRPSSAPSTLQYPSSQNKPNDLNISSSSANKEFFQLSTPPDTPVSEYTSFSSPPQSIYVPNTPTRTLTPLSQEEKFQEEIFQEEKPQEEKQKRKLRNIRKIPTKVTRSLSNIQKQCTRKRIIDDVRKLFEERAKILRDIDQTEKYYNELLLTEDKNEVREENKVIDQHTRDSDWILSELKKLLEEKRKEPSLPSIPNFPFIEIPFVTEPESIYFNNYEVKKKNVNAKFIEIVNNPEEIERIEKSEKRTDVKSPEPILSDDVKMNSHLEEKKDNNLDVEEIEREKCKKSDENDSVHSVENLSVNTFESHSEEEKINKDNNNEKNEKEECVKSDENDSVHNVENQSVNTSESHSEEEEINKDNNNEKNEKEECVKSDEIDSVHNVENQSINTSESHSEEEKINRDNNNENNEREECVKSDGSDSVHSVSESVNLPEIILSHSEEEKSNNPNIINQVNQVNQINQINQYNIINNVTNVQQEEESAFLKAVKIIVKEVENVVDKAVKAHRSAVLRSSSSLSVNEINEKENEVVEVVEEVVEKEVVEEVIEKELVEVGKNLNEKEEKEEVVENLNENEVNENETVFEKEELVF